MTGVPLVFETLSWQHGVMIGAAVKSETTAAAEFKGLQLLFQINIPPGKCFISWLLTCY